MGGGHVVPDPDYTAPRLLGRTTRDVDAPVEIWGFFAKLPSRPSFETTDAE